MAAPAPSTGNLRMFAFTEVINFDDNKFYEKYKTADFLRERRNIAKILVRGHELRQILNKMEPGSSLVIEGMFLKPDVPLVVKSGCGDNSDVGNEEFTFDRLSGLVATYAWRNRSRAHEGFYASEPEELGLVWSGETNERKLYLSAVSGAELFVEDFEYVPLICALRKYQLKKISADMLVKIATTPYAGTEEPMAVRLRRQLAHAQQLYGALFGESFILKEVIKTAPPGVQCFFKNPLKV